ncbi:hypothetical protein EUGRSUZ_H04187 [Eucalyptus grandis]|uniref:Uncharacterized protein n=2 Tax=Eucalyptus grandis TaxID=71139 RepID=A0ACC3JVW9_EUCGR|nr:hypothetical protein EUGRSUZ_H04187 [Eucalyptus grandis]
MSATQPSLINLQQARPLLLTPSFHRLIHRFTLARQLLRFHRFALNQSYSSFDSATPVTPRCSSLRPRIFSSSSEAWPSEACSSRPSRRPQR